MSFTFGLVTAIAGEIPKLNPAYQQQLEVDGYIYANDGETVLSVLRGRESRTLLEPNEIAPDMKRAIIAVEDRRFLAHRGVDLRGIARAAWADIRQKAVVEGGSTITQQFVKNVYKHRTRSLGLKVTEAALAWQLEKRWTKDEILTAYLNTIYFGNGAYGVQQASIAYFKHGAKDLSLAEAALLAGIPSDPARFDPVAHPNVARQRRDFVLRTMREQGMIAPADEASAVNEPLPDPADVRLPGTQGPAPYFGNYVKQQLIDKYGAQRVFGDGLRVRTTIDHGVQRIARDAIAKWLDRPDSPSAALVAIDPRNGGVVAMVGGNYRKSEFNLAAQARRQPGSSFKPFVLAAALEKGIAPSSGFVSRPLTISLGDKLWYVHNYDEAYLGSVTLEEGTVHSDNAVYAQLTQLVGPSAIVKTAHSVGIRSPLNSYFAIGLGAEAVNPLEMARAFSTFANGGYRIDSKILANQPRTIESISLGPTKDPEDNELEPHRVLTRRTAAVVNTLLQEVVSRGTGKRAALPDRPVAGKTGTTENYGDAWFVGYTPQLVAAVWVGYPNKLVPMLTQYDGEPVAGGTYPALIWRTFMQGALEYLDAEPEYFPPPPGLYADSKRVVWRDGRLMLDNGLCREARTIAYFSGKGPTRTAKCKPNEVEVPHVVGQTLAAAERRLSLQPLTPVLVYKPARPLQPVNVVLQQYPARGRLSSYDEVKLVVAKPLDGVVPRLIGLTLRQARTRLRRIGLKPVIGGFGDGPAGRIVSQSPRGGVAAKPGLTVRLVVARG
jgi:penicillin-binding protein 1A